MSKFAMGSAMGFMLGAGLMMSSASGRIRRKVKHEAYKMKRWLRNR